MELKRHVIKLKWLDESDRAGIESDEVRNRSDDVAKSDVRPTSRGGKGHPRYLLGLDRRRDDRVTEQRLRHAEARLCPSDPFAENLAPDDRFLKEIQKEIAKAKLTSAELDEEEQSYERLARWHRDIVGRTMFETASAPAAEKLLKECEAALSNYAERVFRHETE